MSDLTEKDILYSFVNINSSKYYDKPWVSFTDDNVIATNGVSIISVPLSVVEGTYTKWENMFSHEPFVSAALPKISDGRYLKLNAEFTDNLLKTTPNKAEDDSPIITSVSLEINDGKYVEIDWWGLVPIYNAMEFYGGDWFLAYNGKDVPLRFKNNNNIEMAVMPLS